MRLLPEQESRLSQWMLQRLDQFDDVVEADVLTDYIFTLLKGDKALKEVRDDVCQSLQDILEDDTGSFVNDLFQEMERVTDVDTGMPSKRPLGICSPRARSASRKRRYSKSKNEQPITPPTAPRSFRTVSTPRRLNNKPKGDRRHTMSHPTDETRPVRQDTTQVQTSLQTFQQHNPFLNFPADPWDPTLPMKVASFRAMQQHFPYLTQMWVNNMRNQGQYVPDWLFDVDCNVTTLTKEQLIAVGISALTSHTAIPSPATDQQAKCHDYDLTGMCIRGSACSYKHETRPSPTSDASLRQPTESQSPTKDNLFMQRIRSRQAHYQAEHDARRKEEKDAAERRDELAKRAEELDAKLQMERNTLTAKMRRSGEDGRISKTNGVDFGLGGERKGG